jgi:hypothetical protein
MTQQAQNLFGGMKDAKISEQGVYLTDGVFEGKILRCLYKQGRKGNFFIAEIELTSSNVPDKHPVGAKRTWVQPMRDLDIAFSALKPFTYVLLGFNPKDPTDLEQCKAKVDPQCEAILTAACLENKFAGTAIKVEVTTKPTKAGTPFSLHVWSPGAAA